MMDNEDFDNLESRLLETRQLAEENHELLKKIHRSIVWGRIFRIIYWVLIIGAAVGLFYFLEPYLDQVIEIYGGLQEQINTIPGVGGSVGGQ